MATFTRVQKVDSTSTLFNGTGGTGGVTITATPTSGNLLLVLVTYGTNQPNSIVVKDNAGSGQTFASSAGAVAFDSTNTQGIKLFWALANASSGTSIKVTTGGTNFIWFGARLYEISSDTGWDAAIIDGTAVGASGNSNAPSSGNMTTVTNGDYIFGACCNTPGSASTISAGTGYTLWGTSAADWGGSFKMMGEDRTQTTAGAIAGTFSINATQRWAALVEGFKPAAGGGTLPPVNLMSIMGCGT